MRPLRASDPAGTPLVVTEDDGSTTETRTRSEVWPLGDGTLVVSLEGRAGGFMVQRCRAEDQPNAR